MGHLPRAAAPTSVVTVDDTDPSIQYDNTWATSRHSPEAYNGTTHVACSSGVSFTFNFTGTAVKVFGVLKGDFGQPNSSYFLDDALNHTFSAPLLGDNLHQVAFFSQAGLIDETHSLKVVLNNGEYTNGGKSTCMFVDFLEYSPSPERTDANAGLIATTVLAGVAALLAGISTILLWKWIRALRRPAAQAKV